MIPHWTGTKVTEKLASLLPYPIRVANDSKLAAYAENLWGAGQGYDSVVYLKLHSGVGGALVLNGQVLSGSRGGAGEFGHMSLDPNGPVCRCGNRGCLEVYAGVPAVIAALSPMLGAEPTVRQIIEGFVDGQPAFRRVLLESALRAGQAAGLLCNAFNPACVVIGGCLAAAGDDYLAEVRRGVLSASLPLSGMVEVKRGTLGNRASALGAVGLVLASGLVVPVDHKER
jgi:predicted NBD/HSP70 family sugar kinase